MKIFNVEKGLEKVYVQMSDLILLKQVKAISLPSIFDKVDSNLEKGRKETDFVEFSFPLEIDFFKSMDWIVDYKEIRNLSGEEIIRSGKNIIRDMNQLAKTYNRMSIRDKRFNKDLATRHMLLNHALHNITDFLKRESVGKQIPFPFVVDSDGYTIQSDDSLYTIKTSLDPNRNFFYFPKDVISSTGMKQIPYEFLNQTAKNLLPSRINENWNYEEIFGRMLSRDSKYLIATSNQNKGSDKNKFKKLAKTISKNCQPFKK